MSTRNRDLRGTLSAVDPADVVALVVAAKRPILLRVHSHRLRRDDLEECFAQAALELVASVRRDASVFASRIHAERVLEQRFLSRVHDRRRALAGRSATQSGLEQALAPAARVDETRTEATGVAESRTDVADPRTDVERIVLARIELALVLAVAYELSADQRLVIACQVALGWGCGEFCTHFGWSPEKYRKVAQRGRAKLRALAGG